jgi:fumarate reductase subunit C
MNKELDKIKNSSTKYIDFIYKNQVFIVLVVCSAVLIFALLQSRTYLNPERNEVRYEEERLKINYSTIDEEIVNEIRATLDDKNITVDSNFVPDRRNPFAE